MLPTRRSKLMDHTIQLADRIVRDRSTAAHIAWPEFFNRDVDKRQICQH
jgi:hypothetical protein